LLKLRSDQTDSVTVDLHQQRIALRQLGHDVSGVLNVLGAGVSIIGLIEAKAVLPVGLVGDR